MSEIDRWFLSYRMNWIGQMLHVYGYINRAHLERQFGISTPQASKDLQTYARLHPGAMTYDVNKKAYVATS